MNREGGCNRTPPFFCQLFDNKNNFDTVPAGVVYGSRDCFALFCLLVLRAHAAVPYTFSAGNPISASQMNTNFSSVVSSQWTTSSSSQIYYPGSIGVGTPAASGFMFNANGDVNVSGNAYINGVRCPQAAYVGNGATASPGNYLVYATKNFDTTSSYNTTTGLFTAPLAGLYSVSAACYLATAITGTAIIYVNKNGVRAAQQNCYVNNGGSDFIINTVLYLNVGDTVGIYNPSNAPVTLATDSQHPLGIFYVH